MLSTNPSDYPFHVRVAAPAQDGKGFKLALAKVDEMMTLLGDMGLAPALDYTVSGGLSDRKGWTFCFKTRDHALLFKLRITQ